MSAVLADQPHEDYDADGHSIATPTKSMNPLKGARHDHLQSEKFGFRTADSGTAYGICGRWRWQPGRCSTWRRSGCGRDGQCRRWRRSAGRIRWRWPAGGFGGRRIAEFEQRGRQWSGWNGQPQFECRRWRPGRKWHQYTRNFKRQDNWKQHRWLWRFDWRGARIQRAWWWYLARGLTRPTPTHQWSYGTERCPGCCRGGANLADRTIQARTRRGVDGDSGGAVLWRSGSRNRRNDDLHRYSR